MNDVSPTPIGPPPSVEERLDDMLGKVQHSLQHCIEDCEEHVRRSPTASMLTAAAVGYCLHQLPLRAILVAQVRLLSALVPPALFLFGAAKVYDLVQRQSASDSRP
jgi:hypothetical protein